MYTKRSKYFNHVTVYKLKLCKIIDFMQYMEYNKYAICCIFLEVYYMNRTEKEEYIIGSISLLSNKLTQFGDVLLPDITFKQWFLLIMISKMEGEEKSINSIAEFVGTTRQNVKKMLTLLEAKGYVIVSKSAYDARALKVELTEKAYQYFLANDASTAKETNQLFVSFSNAEIDSLVYKLQKLMTSLELYGER